MVRIHSKVFHHSSLEQTQSQEKVWHVCLNHRYAAHRCIIYLYGKLIRGRESVGAPREFEENREVVAAAAKNLHSFCQNWDKWILLFPSSRRRRQNSSHQAKQTNIEYKVVRTKRRRKRQSKPTKKNRSRPQRRISDPKAQIFAQSLPETHQLPLVYERRWLSVTTRKKMESLRYTGRLWRLRPNSIHQFDPRLKFKLKMFSSVRFWRWRHGGHLLFVFLKLYSRSALLKWDLFKTRALTDWKIIISARPMPVFSRLDLVGPVRAISFQSSSIIPFGRRTIIPRNWKYGFQKILIQFYF